MRTMNNRMKRGDCVGLIYIIQSSEHFDLIWSQLKFPIYVPVDSADRKLSSMQHFESNFYPPMTQILRKFISQARFLRPIIIFVYGSLFLYISIILIISNTLMILGLTPYYIFGVEFISYNNR